VPGDRFCVQCGDPLGAGSTPAPPAAPAALEPEGERKQLTVLFADVQGSMDLQEDLDPELWARIMSRFVEILADGIRRYGGTVDKFTGDGVMALFGAPLAQEDHARRACHAAWHLTGAVAAYAEELRQSQQLDLHVRLGLNSGEVVVGRVGEDLQLDPTALGHTVGLAQRMESLAEPGQAYLTGHTARLVEGWFRLKALGPLAVKGSRQPVEVFVLDGPAPSTGGNWVARTPGAAQLLVGRARELAVLDDALMAAAEGRAQLVGVVGEAGVGKSRVCEEFARAAASRGMTVRHTTGVSHGQEVPLLPILALLRNYFGITQADVPDYVRKKVAGRLLELDSGLADDLPLLFDFLEVPEPGGAPPATAPEVRMRRIFEVLRRMTQRGSERDVLVLIVEDLHWFDPQSLAFLERLVESYPGTRTMVVTNFRPGFTASWMRHSYYRQLPLGPLADDDVGQLLANLLGTDPSLAPLAGFVLERTGGNPFFVEEIVRALIEDGTLAGGRGPFLLTRPLAEVRLPPSVQAVLAARIDRLAPEHKRTLQTAAVIGRTFPRSVLAEVMGPAGDLDDTLSALCGAELVQEAGHDPVVEYRFWHPLTQEVAYGSLLAERRGPLHAAVARALTNADPDRLDERAALIAAHFGHAGAHLEAARWEERAAVWVSRRDMGEALRRWQVVLDRLAAAPETGDGLRLGVRARTQLIRIGARAGLLPEQTRNFYREGKERAERLADGELLTMVEFSRGLELFVRGELGQAWTTFLEAARLAEATGDLTLQVITCIPSLVATSVGPISEGLRLADRLEALTAGDPEIGARYLGYSPLVRTLLYRAQLIATAGAVSDGYRGVETSLRLVRERGETEGEAWALAALARLDELSGEAGEGRAEQAVEAARIAEESGNRMVQSSCSTALGVAELMGGRYESAAEALTRGLTVARDQQAGLSEEARLLTRLAQARLGLGEGDAAGAAADEAVEVACRQGARVLACHALLVRAQVRRVATTGDDDRAGARADLDDAAALARETGASTYVPFILEELGRLQGADGLLRQALELYAAIGATGHTRRLAAELDAADERARGR